MNKNEKKNIIDITHTIHEYMPIYPGNPPVEVDERPGDTSQHSRVCFGSHTGTHIDAPKHVFKDGAGVDQLNLEKMVGTCKVVDATDAHEAVTIAHLKQVDISSGDKVLVKTSNSARGFDAFFDDFVYLDGDAAEWLAKKDIDFFGIDYLSVKERGGQDRRPHTALLKNDIVIAEGLDLAGVDPGEYRLVCLPLKLKDGDGAPVRCVLIDA